MRARVAVPKLASFAQVSAEECLDCVGEFGLVQRAVAVDVEVLEDGTDTAV